MPCKPLYRSTHTLYSHNFALEGAIFALEAPYLLFALLLMYFSIVRLIQTAALVRGLPYVADSSLLTRTTYL